MALRMAGDDPTADAFVAESGNQMLPYKSASTENTDSFAGHPNLTLKLQ
ncbi:hypothetical protein Rifp1Sym_bs00010 [endosymbiont of Riftia pachyptila (vent Ph05)]|uniref:Uncharacterized protein n=1 Tax=endosymbiont of Riftia pachyptila (vent Ph05) TaxID=1048808 RepID=G2DDW1_9GAMM|nr:hypothetical protein Rifp1Sym_bs00010 [endosymbiont of Riftia pachyptila (vent Ph05)]